MDRMTSMRIFVSVVENQSFSETAQRIGISNATVSKHIKHLEEDLGAKLLNRTTRNLSVTEIGEIYFERCVNILERIDIADHKVKSQGSKPDERITVNASMDIGNVLLPKILQEIRAKFAGTEFELRLDDHQVDPVEGGFDISIRSTKSMKDSGQEWQQIGASQALLVCSPSASERFGPIKTIGDLRQVNHLSFGNTNRRENWEFEDPSTGERHSLRAHGTLHANSRMTILDAAIMGMGVALLPDFLVGDALGSRSLIELDIGLKPVEIKHFAFYPDRPKTSDQIKSFETLLINALDGNP